MNILIVRLSAMGDVIHALPLARNLKRAGHRVGWVIEEPFAALLAGNPDVDEVFVVRTRRWRRRAFRPATLREILDARESIRRFRAALVLDPQANEKSWWVAQLASAPRVVLDDAEERTNWSRRLAHTRVSPPPAARHAADRVLGLLSPLGAPAREPAPDARYLLAGSHPEAETFLAGLPRPFALYHPGAGWANKSWGEDRFASLAIGLRARGIAPVVSWGPGDESRARDLALRADAPMIPPLDFRGLARVISEARFFAAGDTGPLHLADALSVETVSVFGPTDPERNGPYRRRGVVFSTSLPCAPCRTRYRERKPCLSGIPADDVASAVIARFAPA